MTTGQTKTLLPFTLFTGHRETCLISRFMRILSMLSVLALSGAMGLYAQTLDTQSVTFGSDGGTWALNLTANATAYLCPPLDGVLRSVDENGCKIGCPKRSTFPYKLWAWFECATTRGIDVFGLPKGTRISSRSAESPMRTSFLAHLPVGHTAPEVLDELI
jgi:hypothetical protein